MKSVVNRSPNSPAFFFKISINIPTVKLLGSISRSRQIPGIHISIRSSHSFRRMASSSCFRADCKIFPWADVLKGDLVQRKSRFRDLRLDLPSVASPIAMAAFLVHLCSTQGQNSAQSDSLFKCKKMMNP